MSSFLFIRSLLLLLLFLFGYARSTLDDAFKPSAHGTNWAVLVAGSKGFENYRHQADVCHAYQILKKGGLKDENIIVFMYDDIANNIQNPKKGVIINRPRGPDVYKGVPKDYTGDSATASNLIAVIMGDKKAIKGGSGKVLNTGPNDHVFIYYSDHGTIGVLAMPVGPRLYAKDLIDSLKKKHAAKSYSRMVIYVDACRSGSIFDGLLPTDINIYATTAAKPDELSYAAYCMRRQGHPDAYDIFCLGDRYSVAWMEDSDENDAKVETLGQQYEVVRKRTLPLSHVMQYGDMKMRSDITGLYIGDSSRHKYDNSTDTTEVMEETPPISLCEGGADILYLRQKVKRTPEGSKKRAEAQQKLDDMLVQRKHVDQSVEKIGQLLFDSKDSLKVLNMVRPAGKPLVDDWDCFKSTVEIYEAHCGSLDSYGRKYMRAFANICNAGIRPDAMAKASSHACEM